MDFQIAKALLSAVHRHYPIGAPHLANWNPDLERLVAEKINQTSTFLHPWNMLLGKLRGLELQDGAKLFDHSFLQFPNLAFLIESQVANREIMIVRRFHLYISLLCPFYTCYYEYGHSLESDSTLFPACFHAFHSYAKVSGHKVKLTERDIHRLVADCFPGYKAVPHYELMLFDIQGGVPFKIDPEIIKKQTFSMFEFLFNNEQPESIYP